MNNARMAMMVTGMGFILLAAAVVYYQTDLRKNIPEGVAIAILLALTGLFVIAFSSELRRERRVAMLDVEHVEVRHEAPRRRRVDRVETVERTDVERIER